LEGVAVVLQAEVGRVVTAVRRCKVVNVEKEGKVHGISCQAAGL